MKVTLMTNNFRVSLNWDGENKDEILPMLNSIPNGTVREVETQEEELPVEVLIYPHLNKGIVEVILVSNESHLQDILFGYLSNIEYSLTREGNRYIVGVLEANEVAGDLLQLFISNDVTIKVEYIKEDGEYV
jgi:hypothetical protein